MRKFIINILFFALAFFILEKVFYVFLYISPGLESDKRLEKVINGEINKELVILGSSRGARNIIAQQIEEETGISSYNLSYPGSDIEFHEFLLRSLVKYNTSPEILLLVVDEPAEFLPDQSITFRLDRMYPLVKYQHITNELIDRGEKTILSNFFMLARINKKNFDIRKKNFWALDTISNCGSMPISFQRVNYSFDFDASPQEYTPEDELPAKRDAFLKIQKICKENDIQLHIVFPPNFKNYNRAFEQRIISLVDERSRFYIYDTTNTVYRDKSYFYDESHLQTKGGEIFTNELIAYLTIEEEKNTVN